MNCEFHFEYIYTFTSRKSTYFGDFRLYFITLGHYGKTKWTFYCKIKAIRQDIHHSNAKPYHRSFRHWHNKLHDFQPRLYEQKYSVSCLDKNQSLKVIYDKRVSSGSVSYISSFFADIGRYVKFEYFRTHTCLFLFSIFQAWPRPLLSLALPGQQSAPVFLVFCAWTPTPSVETFPVLALFPFPTTKREHNPDNVYAA